MSWWASLSMEDRRLIGSIVLAVIFGLTVYWVEYKDAERKD